MAQLGKVSPTTAVRAFAKGALSGGGCARAASGGPAKRAVSFLAVHALGPSDIAYTINDADAKVLIVGPDFLDSATTLKENLTTVTQIVAIGEHPIWQARAARRTRTAKITMPRADKAPPGVFRAATI